MDHKNLFMFKSVFPFYINMNTITFFLVVETSLSSDWHFDACKPQNCGRGPNISYPFWIDGVQESFCGYPGFGLSCKNRELTFKMSVDEFIIREIDRENESLLVARKQPWDNPCAPLIHDLTFSRTPFMLGPDQVRLVLLFNCTASLSDEYLRYSIGCVTQNSSHRFLAVFSHDPQLNYVKQSGKCETSVTIPVDKSENESLDRITSREQIIEILNKGFHLRWSASTCSECEGSGGHCGFDWSMYKFNCFCPDRPHLKHCHSRNKSGVKIGIGVAGGVGGILLACIGLFICLRRKKVRSTSSTLLSRNITPDPSLKSDVEKGSMQYPTPIFKYDELEEATENFHSSKELGDGGFGTVYYGKLKDGRAVAVKRIYEHNYKRVEQFMNEINILSRVRHQHLVSLYGCTSRDSRELLLVFEFVPNGTVADHLHGQHAKAGSLTWPVRMNIAIESADALTYLHATEIIHRDVKTNNILLDKNFHVKVADFGLSRLFPIDVTHVSTAPQGTPGYVDPEYYQCYQLNAKSDVYSFGVVLIELISSKPAVDINRHRQEINLASMAINKILNHALHELVDPRLGFDSDYAVRRMITLVAELAFRCLQQEKEMRPSMKEVLECLRNIASDQYKETGEELDVPAEMGLLKGIPPFSPDSVTEKWASISTTPNTSA